jgi:hypothetical protein
MPAVQSAASWDAAFAMFYGRALQHFAVPGNAALHYLLRSYF